MAKITDIEINTILSINKEVHFRKGDFAAFILKNGEEIEGIIIGLQPRHKKIGIMRKGSKDNVWISIKDIAEEY